MWQIKIENIIIRGICDKSKYVTNQNRKVKEWEIDQKRKRKS